MQYVRQFFVLLSVNLLVLLVVIYAGSATASLANLPAGIVVAVVVGTIPAIPTIVAALCANSYAGRFGRPDDLHVYLTLMLFWLIVMVLFDYWRREPFPTYDRGWYRFLAGFAPHLAVIAAAPLLRLRRRAAEAREG